MKRKYASDDNVPVGREAEGCNPYANPEKADRVITITIDPKMLYQLIESADVRADQLDGRTDDYIGEQDAKTADYIRRAIAHVGGAADYNIAQPIVDLTPPDALDR